MKIFSWGKSARNESIDRSRWRIRFFTLTGMGIWGIKIQIEIVIHSHMLFGLRMGTATAMNNSHGDKNNPFPHKPISACSTEHRTVCRVYLLLACGWHTLRLSHSVITYHLWSLCLSHEGMPARSVYKALFAIGRHDWEIPGEVGRAFVSSIQFFNCFTHTFSRFGYS